MFLFWIICIFKIILIFVEWLVIYGIFGLLVLLMYYFWVIGNLYERIDRVVKLGLWWWKLKFCILMLVYRSYLK